MATRKQEQRAAFMARLDRALGDLYHNATPEHPYGELSDGQWDRYMAWFEQEAESEIFYIRDGGPYSGHTIGAICDTGKLYYGPKPAQERSPRYRALTGASYVRKVARDITRTAGMFRAETLERFGITGEWPYSETSDLWVYINQYGKLYQWGRGGRTLAPENLVVTGGGSSFHIRGAEDFEDSYVALVDLCRIVESFNAYVNTWCSRANLTAMWKDYISAEAEDLIAEAEGELEEAGYFA